MNSNLCELYMCMSHRKAEQCNLKPECSIDPIIPLEDLRTYCRSVNAAKILRVTSGA